MLTNRLDVSQGHQTSTNVVPFDMLGNRYGFLLVSYSNFVPKTHAVFEIFDFKKCRYLEIRVRGHSRSSESTQIDPSPITSYINVT